ncbi:MAG: hypothetical protein EOM21_10555 [Gammaproteobacteria bacterium]|nr:hypothetical protein [Gammaproteobacteria bacterium]
MARVYVFTLAVTPSMKVLYSVDHEVGPGCRNERQDVLLVQFFLFSAAQPGGGLQPIQPPGQQPIKIDGIYGPQTAAYIKYYQQASGGRAVIDGKISPVQGGSDIGAIHGKALTISHLNGSYAKRFGVERHFRLDMDVHFPAALKSALFI